MLLKGLFLNTAKANCSIHESGRMCFDCLKLSDRYALDYQEIDENSRTIPLGYDFYVFNYHQVTMGWLDTTSVKNLPGLKATIVLEVAPNNPFVMCPKDDFDAYLVLDPTLQTIYPNVYPFPRPLESFEVQTIYREKQVPIIGTFGFATQGKGFDKVIEAVNREFDEAVIRINIPKGDYVAPDAFEKINNGLKNYSTKKGVQVEITTDFLDKGELIEWCAQNTLNVFLYDRNMPGLSATTDQAIVSGRPLSVSTNTTFRHIHAFLTPYPFLSLKDSISTSQPIVNNIKNEWSPQKFASRFETVLESNQVSHIDKSGDEFELPKKQQQNTPLQITTKRFQKSDFIPPILYKLKNKFIKRKNDPVKKVNQKVHIKTLEPFVHSALSSFSQHYEDLLIDLFFYNRDKGFYVDIGANDPSFNSNTKRFYLKGWTGLNIEPNMYAFEKINEIRKMDLNLNLAVSEKEAELTFYHLSNDSTLSTLDLDTATKMSSVLNLPITTKKVKALPLSTILERYLEGKSIDFMSVDAEGHDLTVLKSNDWNKFRPIIVMVESNNEFEEIREYMDKNDYLHIYNNFYNAIFVDKRTKDQSIRSTLHWNQS